MCPFPPGSEPDAILDYVRRLGLFHSRGEGLAERCHLEEGIRQSGGFAVALGVAGHCRGPRAHRIAIAAPQIITSVLTTAAGVPSAASVAVTRLNPVCQRATSSTLRVRR